MPMSIHSESLSTRHSTGLASAGGDISISFGVRLIHLDLAGLSGASHQPKVRELCSWPDSAYFLWRWLHELGDYWQWLVGLSKLRMATRALELER